MTAWRSWLGIALLLTLSACASLQKPPDLLSGRLSLRVSDSAGAATHSVSAGFDLSGSPTRGELRLNSPLGTTLALARWSPGEVTLDANGERKRYTALDALAQDVFGEPLPLAALFAWLRGQPWAQSEHVALDNGFEQLGWRVDLARWSEGLLVAERTSPTAVLLRARLDAKP